MLYTCDKNKKLNLGGIYAKEENGDIYILVRGIYDKNGHWAECAIKKEINSEWKGFYYERFNAKR